MAAGAMMRFAEAMGAGEDDANMSEAEKNRKGTESVKVLRDFFDAAIESDQVEEFWDLLDDPDIAIPIEMLMQIAEFLGEQYSGNPTGVTSSGTRRERRTGRGSTGGHKPVAQTYSRPEPVAAST
jgi:hypothetical protein